jgi:hypothetical protein
MGAWNPPAPTIPEYWMLEMAEWVKAAVAAEISELSTGMCGVYQNRAKSQQNS